MKNLAFIIMPFAFISLFLGIWGGWVRIGFPFIVPTQAVIQQHGVLLVGSFLGTLISLERVVAAHQKWAWLAPISIAVSLPLLLAGYTEFGYIAILIGSIIYFLLVLSISIMFQQKGNFLMLIGAFFQILAIGVLIIMKSYPMALGGWILFLLFTIVGERLDLTRFLPLTSRSIKLLYIFLFIVTISMVFYHNGLSQLVGIGIMEVAGWLFIYDIALININKKGSYKFLGTALLGAYFWLFIFGVLLFMKLNGPMAYDAIVHVFFIGFVLNMILAHAPIILPSVLGYRAKRFSKFFYVWLILLHVSLIMRLYGDLSLNFEIRKLGGLLNGLSFVVYLFNVAFLVFNSKIKYSHD